MKNLIFLIIFLISCPGIVFADARSDFDYQYSRYREHYNEFGLFKKDYLSNPTLDNQQKALLLAKLSINSRDLTLASFAAYLRSIIAINNAQLDSLKPINDALYTAQQFYLEEASKSRSLVTMQDIDSFNESYLKNYQLHEKSLKAAIVSSKITKFKRLSEKQNEALRSLKAKIPNTVSVRVSERISELESDLKTIIEKIDGMANYLVSDEGMDNADSEVFFSSKIELLSEIRSLQISWMDKLIDLDINYGKI